MIIDFDILYKQAQDYLKTDHTGARCGVREIDDIFRLEKGDLVVLGGNPNDGKSSFIWWYLYRLSMESNWKACYLNFEGKQEEIFWQIHSMYKDVETMRKYVYFTEIQDLRTIDQVTKDIENAKAQADINCYVIDPYSNLLLGDNIDTYKIAQDLAKLQAIGRSLGVTIILLCHPPKNVEEVSIYNIKGSSSFAERCDVGLSLTRDWNTNNTIIRCDKLRANGLRGKVKGEAILKYNKFQFYPIDNNDMPFAKNQVKQTSERQETTPQSHETKGIDNDTPTDQTTRENARESDNLAFLQNTKVSLYGLNEPFKYDGDISLIDAIDWGKNHEDIKKKIEELRKIDREQNETLYRAKKRQLPSFTCCGTFRNERDKNNMTTYANMAVIDLDHLQDIEKAKKEISCLPYVLYCAKSVGGKGLFCIVRIDGNKEDYPLHLNALIDDFKAIDYEIDTSCKDITRLRFCSLDERPFFNANAIVYAKKKENPIPTHLPQKANDEIKTLSKHEQMAIAKIVTETKANHLQLTQNHQDTMYLANVLYSLMGNDGRNYLHLFRMQRNGYDESKTNDLFNYVSANSDTYITNPMGALKAKYMQAIKEKEYN